MVVKHCVYGVCKADSRRLHKPGMKDVWFIPFPKLLSQPEKCTKWVEACGRADFGTGDVTPYSYICSLHFVGGDGPSQEYPDPIPALASTIEVEKFVRNKKRKPPTNRDDVTPVKPKRPRQEIQTPDDLLMTIPTDATELKSVETQTDDFPFYTAEKIKEYRSIGTETDNKEKYDITPPSDHLYAMKCPSQISTGSQTENPQTSNNNTQTDFKEMKRQMFADDVENSPRFYTGMSLEILKLVFEMVKDKAERMKYWEGPARSDPDDVEDVAGKRRGPTRELTKWMEFLACMVRLRRGLDLEILSDMLCVSITSISRVFTTWILFLRRELSFLVQWPSKEQIKYNFPKAFKFFPKTRVVIDCTEFFVQKPSLPSSQRITWSSYKHHNTFKLLVGITPSGSFSFVSNLWSGAVSDKKIVQESGFLDKIEYGDEVMADRGFLFSDSLALRGATLAIPPFSHGRQLSSRAVTKTRRIANARIHVERAIGELKNLKLLQGVLSLRLKPLLDDIVFVCCALCNLQPKLVK